MKECVTEYLQIGLLRHLFQTIFAIIQNTTLYNITEIHRQNQYTDAWKDNFICYHITNTRHIYAGIDSTGFKITHASDYYEYR